MRRAEINQFKLLTPEDYGKYWITHLTGFDGKATWYAHPTTYSYTGPWLILALLQPIASPETLIFHLCAYDEEYISAAEGFEEEFDILRDTSGIYVFSVEELKELIALLKTHAEQLSDVPKHRQTMFQQISATELPKWHINPGLLPNTKQKFYYQIYDPLDTDKSQDFATLVIFHRSKYVVSYRQKKKLGLSICHFPRKALNDPAYDPQDYGFGRISLNQEGAKELIQLLEEHWQSL